MTEDQKTALDALFDRRFWNRDGQAEIRLYGNICKPEAMDTTKAVEMYDRNAARLMDDIKKLLPQLEAYRVALAERYSHLVTAPAAPFVRLERHKGYSSKLVTYDLIYGRTYLDSGKQIIDSRQTFPGKERRAALDAFYHYLKNHPGIDAELHIEKSQWER
jgi:hypothetical protein